MSMELHALSSLCTLAIAYRIPGYFHVCLFHEWSKLSPEEFFALLFSQIHYWGSGLCTHAHNYTTIICVWMYV